MRKTHLSRHYGEPGGQALPEKQPSKTKSLRRHAEKGITGAHKNALRSKMK